jgi:hypothetical protein
MALTYVIGLAMAKRRARAERHSNALNAQRALDRPKVAVGLGG